MREPTFADAKVARWADLYQKRARLTGQLPEDDVLQQMGMSPGDPFWKEDNANPSKGFAINAEYDVGEALRAESATDIVVVSLDDFQRKVSSLPISKTSRTLYFGINSPIFELSEVGQTIKPNEFIWQAARAFQRTLLEVESCPKDSCEDEEDKDEAMCSNPEDYTIRRVSWMSSVNAWYVIVQKKEANKAEMATPRKPSD